MRKIILTLVGAALIAGSPMQAAFSREHHHARSARQFTAEQFRNSRAYAAPSYAAPPYYAHPSYVPYAPPSYEGAMGAWGSMTGFN